MYLTPTILICYNAFMKKTKSDFTDLKAIFLNCSIKKNKTQSHTQRLLNRVAGIMKTEGVKVTHEYILDYDIAFGMIKDGKPTGQKDDWPKIQKKIMAADILIIGSPIWLGVKSSVATLVIERMYAYSGDHNEKDQYLYYGKTGGCVRSEEHTSELQSPDHLVCRLLLEKKKNK